MKYSLLSVLTLSMLTLGMAACNEDDADNSPGKVNLPGNGNTALSDVTAEDATAICMSISETNMDMFAQSMEFTCKLAGIMTAGMAYSIGTTDGLPELCESTMAECMTEEKEEAEEDASYLEAECTDAADMVPDSCDATISDLEGCINAMNKASMEMMEAKNAMLPSCADLTADTLDTLIAQNETMDETELETPAACDIIVDKCPELAAELELIGDVGGNDGVDLSENMFHCADNEEMIPLDWVCDGEEDCTDGSDEADC